MTDEERKEKQRIASKRWYEKNKDKVLSNQKERYELDKLDEEKVARRKGWNKAANEKRKDDPEYKESKQKLRKSKHTKEQEAQYRQSIPGKVKAYKRGAKERGIPFELSREEFISYWQKPCQYCGTDIETIGIDRVDNTIGYTKLNCVPCCSICNRMKNNLTTNDFIAHIRRIHTKMIQGEFS